MIIFTYYIIIHNSTIWKIGNREGVGWCYESKKYKEKQRKWRQGFKRRKDRPEGKMIEGGKNNSRKEKEKDLKEKEKNIMFTG